MKKAYLGVPCKWTYLFQNCFY